jgi:hypothetical protein
MPKPKKNRSYFTKITDLAISAYNKSEDSTSREKIYRRFIYPAFMKLTENIINKVKPDYIDSSFQDLQTDLVTYLTARLDKFNPNAGKAYSYYTRTSFNYLIAENQKGYAKVKSDTLEINNDEMRETLREFMDAYIEHCYDNLNYIFSNSIDIHVADSVLHIFETREDIDNFNKKALYILIRERTGLETTNITRVIKTLKTIYEDKFREYEQTDFIKLPF